MIEDVTKGHTALSTPVYVNIERSAHDIVRLELNRWSHCARALPCHDSCAVTFRRRERLGHEVHLGRGRLMLGQLMMLLEQLAVQGLLMYLIYGGVA